MLGVVARGGEGLRYMVVVQGAVRVSPRAADTDIPPERLDQIVRSRIRGTDGPLEGPVTEPAIR